MGGGEGGIVAGHDSDPGSRSRVTAHSASPRNGVPWWFDVTATNLPEDRTPLAPGRRPLAHLDRLSGVRGPATRRKWAWISVRARPTWVRRAGRLRLLSRLSDVLWQSLPPILLPGRFCLGSAASASARRGFRARRYAIGADGVSRQPGGASRASDPDLSRHVGAQPRKQRSQERRKTLSRPRRNVEHPTSNSECRSDGKKPSGRKFTPAAMEPTGSSSRHQTVPGSPVSPSGNHDPRPRSTAPAHFRQRGTQQQPSNPVYEFDKIYLDRGHLRRPRPAGRLRFGTGISSRNGAPARSADGRPAGRGRSAARASRAGAIAASRRDDGGRRNKLYRDAGAARTATRGRPRPAVIGSRLDCRVLDLAGQPLRVDGGPLGNAAFAWRGVDQSALAA